MVYQKLALLAQNKFGQAQKRPSTLGDDGRGRFLTTEYTETVEHIT